MSFLKRNKKKNSSQELTTVEKRLLDRDLQVNLDQLKEELGNSQDIIIREFNMAHSMVRLAVIYMDGLTDKQMVNDFVMRSLMIDTAEQTFINLASNKSAFDFIKENALTIGDVKVIQCWNEFTLATLSGDTVILIDGSMEAISGSTRGYESRGVSEPTSQVVIRGPKEGFSESIGTNVALVRRRIKSPSLRLETMKIGSVTQTDVAVMYIKGIANDKLVQEVKQRLDDIKIDGILDSAYIEELIQDETFSPFPTLFNTERPDTVSAQLLEGRIAILVDGTPFALIAPTTFFMYFQSSEDYYERFDISTAVRLLRYLAFLLSLLGPSIYIAAITFHQEMIPTPLLISIAGQREGIPFPAFIEVLMMEITFEILREAGVRMPRAVGQAVSIVGALVLGQAAVEAGIVSSSMVIVVALTGIASFATPAFNMAISVRLLRFMIMIFAATFGFYGIVISNMLIIAHLCSLRSFGVPYMAPLAPYIPEDQKDTLIRLPLWTLLGRPRLVSQNKRVRMQRDIQPSPPQEEDGRLNR
ncbi:spore germination protein [Ammoniphilus sp. YIM 78166]|uniref:spore germination protein n=1 Tax=Ammoniphilus sp. YIM 78166 TaxID=1644106 RepID=UPI001F1088D5|nr:spore germination protein [Ammoniphilus sp. YIM 78166]